MQHGQYIISGYINGQKFRPSNWSERLCEAGAVLDPLKRVMRYSEHFYPRQCEEYGCSVYVDFDALDTELMDYIHWFIESNGLDTIVVQTRQSTVQLTEVQCSHSAPLVRPTKRLRRKAAA